jgi:hypothetical protein
LINAAPIACSPCQTWRTAGLRQQAFATLYASLPTFRVSNPGDAMGGRLISAARRRFGQ